MMAVDLVGGGKMDDLVALQEATDAGVRSLEHLVFRLSHLRSSPSDCSEIAITTISRFKQVISVLDRTGHARFRRGQVPATDGRPSLLPEPPKPRPLTAPRALTLPGKGGALCDLACALRREAPSLVVVPQEEMPRPRRYREKERRSRRPMPLLLQEEVSPPDLRHPAHFSYLPSVVVVSRSCRRSRAKRTIRVAAISSRDADIPPDEQHSWRKYGQKPSRSRAPLTPGNSDAPPSTTVRCVNPGDLTRLALAQGLLQVQQLRGVPGEEARGAGGRRPLGAHRDLGGGAPAPPRPSWSGAHKRRRKATCGSSFLVVFNTYLN
ncbi:hypothetical protein BHM03_00057991 [Ensete ventricosum]|nr:hypothetical protein BHM03_00057991 [Ensete ventricosum]